MEIIHFPNTELPLKTKYLISQVDSTKIPKKAGFEWQKPTDGNLGYWYTYDPAIATKLSGYGDSAVKQSIQEGLEFKNKIYNLSFSDGVGFDYDVPCPKGINPKTGKPYAYMPFQKVGIYLGNLIKSLILGDEMGLGKTIQAIGIINADETVKSVLVVTKKKLKSNWVKECKSWLTRKMSVGAGLIHCEIVVVNYDQLVRRNIMVQVMDEETGEPVYDKKGKPLLEEKLDEEGNEEFYPNPLLDALIDRDWDMLIMDECHKIKNNLAKRTKGVFEIAGWNKDEPTLHNPERIRYRLALTGTPIPNRPLEMYTTLKLLMPFSKLAKLWYYGQRYCKGNTTATTKYYGNCNLDELQLKLRQTVLVRRMKAQVLKELPPKMHSIVTLDAEGSALAFVNEQIKIQVDWQKKQTSLKADMQLYKDKDEALYHTAFSKLKECQGVYFTEMAKVRKKLAIEKMPYVIDHVGDMLKSGIDKILIGVHHHEVADGIAEALMQWGVVTLDGRNQSVDYQLEAENSFMTDPDCRVFVGGIQSCGEGLNLTSAHHVVFAELDWVSANLAQFEDRTHRIGQENHVMVQHLVFDGSLDSKFIEKVIEKQAIADEALDSHAINGGESKDELAA